jgi:hypothetical protein
MRDKLISVLVVNLNNLDYTKKCFHDLLNQDEEFNLRLIDQNSTENGTSEFLEYVENLETGGRIEIEVIKNTINVPLNHLWNRFVEETKTPFICFLNNDVSISPNFISSAIEVFNDSPDISFVNHVTNNKEYKKWSKKLKYKIIDHPYRQGWDPIFRRENYFKIPEEIKFFYGDDYIYSKTYSSGFKGAYILSSPMIHFERSTTAEKGGQRDCSEDGIFFNSLDLEYKNLTFIENFSKWKPEFFSIEPEEINKGRAYITHVTRDYLGVALNLAKSIRLFSEIPLIVYCINMEEEDQDNFREIENVYTRNIDLDIGEASSTDYIEEESGNFYINRSSSRIYKILCAKTIAMEMALEEGWGEVCYLDSDCLATPLIDELFDWSNIITDYPIATEGIYEYMIWTENGVQRGNPFEFSWPVPDNKLSLEWPLMNFLGMDENQRGIYRTTGIMLMNQKCLPFIKTWKELCQILSKLVDLKYYAAYHEETVYNVLSWKKTNEGFPLCYVNLGEGLETVKHFYSVEAKEGTLRWSDEDTSQNFYMIPEDKRNVKVLHGEKRSSEVDLILDYLRNIR